MAMRNVTKKSLEIAKKYYSLGWYTFGSMVTHNFVPHIQRICETA